MHEDRVDSRWDSCDGRPSTYGWDPVTVDVLFTVGETTSVKVVAHVSAVMGKLGWTSDAGEPGDGTWVWSRQVNGKTATAALEFSQSASPPDWSLDAQAPPAAHPVTDC